MHSASKAYNKGLCTAQNKRNTQPRVQQIVACRSKNGPSKIGSPGTNFLINKDPWNLFFYKIWTSSEKFEPPHTDEKNIDHERILLTKFEPVAILGGIEVSGNYPGTQVQQHTMYKPHSRRNRMLH